MRPYVSVRRGAVLQRITVFLPVRTEDEIDAAVGTREWLQELRHLLPQFAVSGFTYSLFIPHAFEGYYFSNDRNCWIDDHIAQLIVDVSFENDVLERFVELLQLQIANIYMKSNCAQDDIGISVNHLATTTYV